MYSGTQGADFFKPGDKVTLGNGEEGVVKQHVISPTGFHSYRVAITSGARAGDIVGATAPAMRRRGLRQAQRWLPVRVDSRIFNCRVARSPLEHQVGLQGSAPLNPDEGMLFVFDFPRHAAFHMGTVSFPIDIMFVDSGGRVARVIRDAQPGSRESWAYSPTGSVIEVAAGYAPKVGSRVALARHAQRMDLSVDERYVLVEEAADLVKRFDERHARDVIADRVLQLFIHDGAFKPLVQDIVDQIMRLAAYKARDREHRVVAVGGTSPTLTLSDREYDPSIPEQHKNDTALDEVHHRVLFPLEQVDSNVDPERYTNVGTPDEVDPNADQMSPRTWVDRAPYNPLDTIAPFRPTAGAEGGDREVVRGKGAMNEARERLIHQAEYAPPEDRGRNLNKLRRIYELEYLLSQSPEGHPHRARIEAELSGLVDDQLAYLKDVVEYWYETHMPPSNAFEQLERDGRVTQQDNAMPPGRLRVVVDMRQPIMNEAASLIQSGAWDADEEQYETILDPLNWDDFWDTAIDVTWDGDSLLSTAVEAVIEERWGDYEGLWNEVGAFPANARVHEVFEQLQTIPSNLGERIALLHYAVTVAHNNGPMATRAYGRGAVDVLSQLSEGLGDDVERAVQRMTEGKTPYRTQPSQRWSDSDKAHARRVLRDMPEPRSEQVESFLRSLGEGDTAPTDDLSPEMGQKLTEMLRMPRGAAFLVEASKKLNKLLDRLGINLDLPPWAERDHAAKNWLARSIAYQLDEMARRRIYPQEGRAVPKDNVWEFHSKDGRTNTPPPPDEFNIGLIAAMPNSLRSTLQRNLQEGAQAWADLQPYVDHGEKLGIDWNEMPLLTRMSDIYTEVREAKGPREFNADFEMLSDRVIKVNNAEAATLLHGAHKSTEEEADYGWCTGWWWSDHFEDYHEEGRLYLVRTGPATEKRILNGVEVPMASNNGRDIFNVYIRDAESAGEVRAPGNERVTYDELLEVMHLLQEAGVDTNPLAEAARKGDLTGYDATASSRTVYAVTVDDITPNRALARSTAIFVDHADAKDAAQEAKDEALQSVYLYQLEVTGESFHAWSNDPNVGAHVLEVVDALLLEDFEVAWATVFVAHVGNDVIDGDEDEDGLVERLYTNEDIRHQVYNRGLTITEGLATPTDLRDLPPEDWYFAPLNPVRSLVRADDCAIYQWRPPFTGEFYTLVLDKEEQLLGTYTDVLHVAVALAASRRADRFWFVADEENKDITKEVMERAAARPSESQHPSPQTPARPSESQQTPDDDLSIDERIAQQVELVDPVDMFVGMLQAMSAEERPLDWHRNALSPKMKHAIVTKDDLASWVANFGLTGNEATDVLSAVSSPEGLQVLGDGFVLSGIAKIANVTDEGQLILWDEYDDTN